MVNSAVIYPYDDSNISLLLFDNSYNCKITHVVSPSAWGYCSKDAGENLGIVTSYTVINDLTTSFNKVNVLILLEPQHKINKFELFILALDYLKAGKDVILLCELDTIYLDILEQTATFFGSQFIIYSSLDSEPNISTNYTLINPPVPVIGIVGLASHTNKFDTLLPMNKNFKDKGYKTLCITAKYNSNFLQVMPYPEYMFSSSMDIHSKIIAFNYYVNELYHQIKPDVILIEIPGGMFPISNKLHEKFAFQNYLVSNAISFDACVANLLYEN